MSGVLSWADELRRLGVRANADGPEDATRAREPGAEGIGLCRTEPMFMAEDRQPKMREMIMTQSADARRRALAQLLPLQQEDFEGLYALGFSRDDVESKFVPTYLERKIIDRSPFETIDQPGVGWLVRLAAWVGREARPDLKLGICGEHGGDPQSITFFHKAGLDYVSCSPYRIPIARIAAAQAAIEDRRA